eukprot:1993758-Lingulodinium_polyedra.AAC.1
MGIEPGASHDEPRAQRSGASQRHELCGGMVARGRPESTPGTGPRDFGPSERQVPQPRFAKRSGGV